jgi:redox-sensitive bicupin YhaK (pirin superfamily)
VLGAFSITPGPHPRLGLQTCSWMLERTIPQRDSLGYDQWIRPGRFGSIPAGR